jgi:hypothetical protein
MHRHGSLSLRKSLSRNRICSILSKKSLKSNDLDHAFIEKGSHDDALSDISCCSFLTLKKRHEGKKGRGASPHPTLNDQQLEEKV